MRRNQILVVTLCSFACLGYSSTSANGGWFGPSNYNECMVDKMKGQPWNMGQIVATACALQFVCDAKSAAGFSECTRTLPVNDCTRIYCSNH